MHVVSFSGDPAIKAGDGGNLPDSKELFLRTTRIELTAVLTLARRYQNLALGMADKETDPEQRENLLCLADMRNAV